MEAKFVDLAGLAEWLAISASQARALVVSGEIPAIQVGGRNQWRIEISELEAYIARKYIENEKRIAAERAAQGLSS